MTPEEAELVQLASAVAAAKLRNDDEGVGILIEEMRKSPRYPEAMIYLALTAVDAYRRNPLVPGRLSSVSVRDVWSLLRPVSGDVVDIADRDGAAALATAMVEGIGGAERDAIHERMSDVGVLLVSGYDLALAALELLEADGVLPAVEWCRLFAEGTAGGIGVGTA